MKLNNNGWGYREMIIYTCIILFALVFVAISISSFYDNLMEDISSNKNNTPVVSEPIEEQEPTQEPVTDGNYYLVQENKLKNATLEYVQKYSYDLTEDILNVSIDTLVSFGFMDPIYDQTGTYKCSGYSNVYINGSNYGIVPYISCNNYTTNGY